MARGNVLHALKHFRHFNLWPFILAVVINFVSLLIVSFRLRKILAVHEIKLSIGRIYYLWMISLFFNLFLPSAVGGDVAKAYYIYKDSNRKLESVSSVLMDRFLGLMGTVVLALGAFLFARASIHEPHVGFFLALISSILIGGIAFVTNKPFSTFIRSFLLQLTPKKFREQVKRFLDELALYHDRKTTFLVGFLYAVLAQTSFIVLFYFLAQSIQVQLPLPLFFVLVPIVTLLSMMPSIGGLGVREAAIVYLFKAYVPAEQAVALSILAAVFIYGTGAACGILFAVCGGGQMKDFNRLKTTSS